MRIIIAKVTLNSAQICARDFRAHEKEQEKNPWPERVFGEDLKIFQIPDKFYGPPRGGFTSGYERSSEPMLTRTKDIYYPECYACI